MRDFFSVAQWQPLRRNRYPRVPPPGHSTPRVERRTLDSAEHRDTMLRLVTTRAARHAARAVAPACNVAFQRGYAESGDIVKDVFLNQQKQFRALLDATKDLEVPVNGDRAAIKAYAEKRKAIMQKVRRRRNARTETRTRRDRRATGVGDPPVPGKRGSKTQSRSPTPGRRSKRGVVGFASFFFASLGFFLSPRTRTDFRRARV